jgi:pimeloyl-ACP methyl ester carboxylesterase
MQKILNFLLAKSLGLYINLLSFVFPKKASQLAYAFFSEPRTGKLSKHKLPEILKEATTETLINGEHTFQVYTWKGNETTLLLVHGWESNASRWENFIPYLKKSGCTIVAIDAPAHGLSSGKEFSVPKYAEFIHLAVEKFRPQYLIGHSIGGNACLYYQYAYPNDAVEKMVVLGAPSDFSILIQNYSTLLSLNSKITKDLEDHYINFFKQKIEDFSGRKFASTFSIKGLIAHDANDDVVSISEGKKIAEAWKSAQFIETKGLGHSMHDDALYQNIYQFLFETE